MHQLKIRIRLESPVVISAQSGDSTLTGTLDYIPGSSILGLVAGKYLKARAKDAEFDRIFLRGDVHFNNLYPVRGNDEFLPCPQNIWRSKSDPGRFINIFSYPNNADDYQKVDTYARVTDNYIDVQPADKEIFFHHERDYARGISKSGVVFNYEALSAGQEFTGCIQGSKDDIGCIQDLLIQDKTLRIGKSKTSQYGNAVLMTYENSEYSIDKERELAGSIMVMASDTIIKNTMGISTVELSELERILNTKITSAALNTSRIETIVNAHRAKRPSEIAFKAGSVFILEVCPTNAEDLVMHGLGERTWEGFGQVYFPEEFPDNLSLLGVTAGPTRLPQSEVPDVIRRLVTELRDQLVTSKISSKAEDIAANIGPKKLSNSLLGRLESFARSGNFNASFARLRSISKQNLQNAHLENTNLAEYLAKIDQEIQKLIETAKAIRLGSKKSLRDLIVETHMEEIDPEKLKSVFLHTLFLSLRRINNDKGRQDEER